MTWAAVIAAMLQLFGPLVLQWVQDVLDRWLKKAAANLSPPNADPATATAVLFDEAVRLAHGHPLHRAVLRHAKPHAIAHAVGVFVVAADPKATPPTLSGDEIQELSSLTPTMSS